MRSSISFLSVLFLSGLVAALAQDVNMQSDSEEGILLNVENTGTTDKTAVNVNSTTAYGSGMVINASLVGMSVYTNNNPENYGSNMGIYSETHSSTYNLGGIMSYSIGGWEVRAMSAHAAGGEETSQTMGLYSIAEGGASNIGIYSYADVNENNQAAFIDGDGVYTSSWSQFSDENLKTNIRNVTGGLAKVMALKPKLYDMKREQYKNTLNLSKDHQYGLLAQDVQSVLPELVRNVPVPQRRTKEDVKPGKLGQQKQLTRTTPQNFKTLNYTGLIPVMLAAIQEQQAQIEALKAKVSSLEK